MKSLINNSARTWLLALLTTVATYSSKAQFVTWVIHTDLPVTQIANSAYKIGWLEMYSSKLKEIKENRDNTLRYLGIIEEVQRKVFNTLSNVSGAVKDGKTMIAITKKVPIIFENLQKSVELAAGKPYMLVLVKDIYQVFYLRILKLTDYLKEVVLSNDEKILIDPVRRHRFVTDVYNELNVLQQMSKSICNQYELHNLQDAIDSVVPLSTFYNIDRMVINDILTRIKLF